LPFKHVKRKLRDIGAHKYKYIINEHITAILPVITAILPLWCKYAEATNNLTHQAHGEMWFADCAIISHYQLFLIVLSNQYLT